jgi:phage gp29-like protein
MDFKNKFFDKVLSYIPDGKVKVEAAIRSEKRNKSKLTEIKRASTLFQPKTLTDWKNAVALATDPENPEFLFLAELYENLKLDSHLVSVIESRIYRVLRSEFVFVNDAGDEVPEVKELFERPWFEEFLTEVMWSKFDGVKVLEIFHVNENLELFTAEAIPMAHVNPKKGLILKEPGETTGWNYRSGVLKDYYLQIGKDNDLGMLSELATLVLAKKLAMGSHLDYIEKYGIPPKSITTDNMTQERADELLQMGLDMVSNHVVVLQGNEKIEFGFLPTTDAHHVFTEMIKVINDELSKRVVGQTMTTENGSSRSQAEVHLKVANDRHESDKLFAKYIINEHLLPRLLKLSSFYAPLANLSFDWDNSEEMEKETMIDKAVALTNAGFVLDYQILADKTGMPITGFNTVEPSEPILDPKKKKQKPIVKQ